MDRHTDTREINKNSTHGRKDDGHWCIGTMAYTILPNILDVGDKDCSFV